MHVRVRIAKITRRLHDRDHPEPKRLFVGGRDHELEHRLLGSASQPAEQHAVVNIFGARL